MSQSSKGSKLHLPKSWPSRVRSALVHVLALAQYAAVYSRSWAGDSRNTRVRLRATIGQLQQEIALLRAVSERLKAF